MLIISATGLDYLQAAVIYSWNITELGVTKINQSQIEEIGLDDVPVDVRSSEGTGRGSTSPLRYKGAQ